MSVRPSVFSAPTLVWVRFYLVVCPSWLTGCWLFRCTRWFKYDRDKLWLVYTQIVPVIFEPPCINDNGKSCHHIRVTPIPLEAWLLEERYCREIKRNMHRRLYRVYWITFWATMYTFSVRSSTLSCERRSLAVIWSHVFELWPAETSRDLEFGIINKTKFEFNDIPKSLAQAVVSKFLYLSKLVCAQYSTKLHS